MIIKKEFLKKILGVLFAVVGFLALVRPFTPGSWLFFVGLEFLGIRILFFEKFKKK